MSKKKTLRLQYPKEYRAWARARERCGPNAREKFRRSYFGRGIRVCAAWDRPGGFAAFFACVGKAPSKAHSLDRINNDGDYKSGNLRWATRMQQCSNKTNNRRIESDGKELTLSQWARIARIPIATFRHRLKELWTPEAIVRFGRKRMPPSCVRGTGPCGYPRGFDKAKSKTKKK